MSSTAVYAADVVLVDDVPANLSLLSALLEGEGYRVRACSNGPEALATVQREPPNLILLDIRMPEMDGYEVCRRLKSMPSLAAIPVIFLSALNDTADKVQAFQSGGVDYVSKPFQVEEVLARVRIHLRLRQQRQELEASYRRLQSLERLRDQLTQLMVHDMRSPLSGILTTLTLAADTLPSPDPGFARLLEIATHNALRLREWVTQLLDISRLEADQMPLTRAACNLSASAASAITSVTPLVGKREVRLQAPEAIDAVCDPDVVGRVLVNLLDNALKFAPPDGVVAVRVEPVGDLARVSVADSGPGIPHELQAAIFQKYGPLEHVRKKHGAGLGLTFCKLAVEAHGGSIGVTSGEDGGCTFWFTLPRKALEPSPAGVGPTVPSV